MIAICIDSLATVLAPLAKGEWPGWIDHQTKSRIQRYHRLQDRQRSLAGVMLSRKMISALTGVSEGDITVLRDQCQKPFLPHLDLHFNLSHSGNHVACAVGPVPLGIDLEQVRPVQNFTAICKRVFTPAEQAAIEAGPPEDVLDRFFDYWTLKESYLKALGYGLSKPLQSFSIEIDRGRSPQLIDHSEMGPWYFKLYRLGDSYRCAVCAASPLFPDQPVCSAIGSEAPLFRPADA